jgi:hypothetical protein
MVTKLHYLWEKEMQYIHDNFKMHTICGAKCNTHIMTLIHIIMGEGNVIFAWQFKDAHYMWRQMQYLHDNLEMHIICGRGKCNTYMTI